MKVIKSIIIGFIILFVGNAAISAIPGSLKESPKKYQYSQKKVRKI
ncbi:MAG: hypothetical protein ACRCYC_08950 [Paraclostridium sp.]